jgi:ABC-type microcin C transport system permease subunit YejB
LCIETIYICYLPRPERLTELNFCDTGAFGAGLGNVANFDFLPSIFGTLFVFDLIGLMTLIPSSLLVAEDGFAPPTFGL